MEITHPTYEVFAANVTCKERSPNLENKVNKSVIDVIVLIMFWGLLEARTCVCRQGSSLQWCLGLAASLTAIQLDHYHHHNVVEDNDNERKQGLVNHYYTYS